MNHRKEKNYLIFWELNDPFYQGKQAIRKKVLLIFQLFHLLSCNNVIFLTFCLKNRRKKMLLYWYVGKPLNNWIIVISFKCPIQVTPWELGENRSPCGDTNPRPYTYCRRCQFMPVHSAHIVALKHILSPVTIYADIDTFFQGLWRENICFKTLTQVVVGDRICRQH